MPRSSLLLLVLLLAANAFAAGRELAPPAFGPTPYYTQNTRTAFAGNRFLTVWSETRGELGQSLVGVLHDAQGRRVSHVFSILPTTGSAYVIGTGDSFALIWNDENTTFLTDVDLDGRVVRTTPLALPEMDTAPRTVWNGRRLLFLWVTYENGFVTRMSIAKRSGEMVQADVLLDNASDVWPASGGFTLIANGPSGLCRRSVTNAGEFGPITCVALDVPYPRVAPLAGGGMLVAWTDTSGALRSTLVRPDGTVGTVNNLTGTPEHPLLIVHFSRVGDRHVLLYTREIWPAFVRSIVLDAEGAPVGPSIEIAPNRVSYVAAASSGDTIFAAFDPLSFQTHRIMIGSDGSPRGVAEPITIGRMPQFQPAIANVGSRILAAWTEKSAATAFVAASSLTSDGEPLFFGAVARGQLVSRDLPSSGSEVLVVTKREIATDNTVLEATPVSHDGAPLAESIRLAGPWLDWPASASSTWNGDRWLVAWTLPYASVVQLSTVRNRSLQETRTLPVESLVPERRYRTIQHVALARNAHTTLLVWTEALPLADVYPSSRRNDLYRTYAARITEDTTRLDPVLELPSGGHSLSVATSGDEFVILTGGTATVIDADATRVLRSTTIFGWEAAGDVEWDGSMYTVALRYKLAKWYVSVAHLDRSGLVIGSPRGVETLAADLFAPPSIAGSVIALQEGDWIRGARAVAYHETALPPLPEPPPEPVLRFENGSGHGYKVVWDAVPRAELYVVRGGAVLGNDRDLVQIIPATEPLFVDGRWPSVRVIAVGMGGASSSQEPE